MSYDATKAEAICARLADGESLRSICRDEAMPSKTEVMRWLADDANSAFRDQYARAHDEQATHYAAEVIEIADEECTMVRADKHGSKDEDGSGNTEVVFDATAVARNRLRVDARKWYASKLAPKKYGDKVQTEHSGSVAFEKITREIVDPK